MILTLYPLIQERLNHKTAPAMISQLWQNQSQSDEVIYNVYSHYEADFEGSYKFSIAVELPQSNGLKPIYIEDLNAFEKFITDRENLAKTWELINKKTQQGLLKRLYEIDLEKYYPDGRVEIYISIVAHC
ncbi:hypothetical protein A6B43_04670 [Vespertiliibacter pulmonis]|uniref:Putative transcriptional regulator YdeE n=1 Tax=Vespertiliibacter pulmonis TaxID=1443036 RepID=A0A3N4WBW8_9PAST|nr:AraC family transcriptional regulator [Vespertiliibacter pulmonis]QLB20868.1 hypothetical protein A6B43_04670 [Vespertiliibacter pulmonis]RPE83520.1 putative transcriptional regulator YdeE [Vespertiliibacter pulmonis]